MRYASSKADADPVHAWAPSSRACRPSLPKPATPARTNAGGKLVVLPLDARQHQLTPPRRALRQQGCHPAEEVCHHGGGGVLFRDAPPSVLPSSAHLDPDRGQHVHEKLLDGGAVAQQALHQTQRSQAVRSFDEGDQLIRLPIAVR